ncbi:MAG: hypothetical protein MUE63_00150 [Xanthomonadales bacterium]|jgi:hypothetical protein|nr:hypothetical protein [Xanthomonadales bacterium]
MALLKRKAALLAKTESVYGTDPVPTGAANAILVSDVTIMPMEMKTVDRDNIRPFLGSNEQLPTGLYTKIDFTCEAAGSGAAGTAPAWGPLLLACGFAETISAGVKVEYSPVSAAFSSVTIYFNIDGLLHKLTGARGTMSLDFTRDGRPAMKFSFTGLFNTVADAASPTLTLTAWQKPLAVNRTNTPTLTVHGYAGRVHSLTADMANEVVFREMIGAAMAEVLITDRKPAGQILMEAELVATKDWWTSIKNITTGAVQLIHGTTAGNKFQVDAPNVQLINPQYQDQDGIAMLQAGLVFAPSTGNDEIKITAL